MTELALLILGLILGGVAAWFLASSRASGTVAELRAQLSQLQTTLLAKDQQIADLNSQVRAESEQKVAAQTELNQVQLSLAEQRQLLEAAETRLADTFHALADNALKSNNQAFLDLAGIAFGKMQAEAETELETRKIAVEGLVKPLKESLESLDAALRTSQGRGLWGQLQLRRVVELAGMSEHCDFTEQETLTSETGQQRPDMIVNLPGGIRIAVDAKVPLQAFLDADAAATDAERTSLLARHGQLVRDHINKLGAKNYWEQFDHAPDFVILYLPGESFFTVALQQDKALIEDGWGKNVSLASPSTLIALLRGIAYGWRQERLAKNAQEISDLGKELYDRIRTFTTHFEEIRSGLARAVEGYNKATGSLERRVLISARRFKELGAATGEEIMEVETIEQTPRLLEVVEPGKTE
ncbi:MAG: hypothetical protein HW398_1238 [Acidobacteria bacterium]|nr:hypothetical protein [Acidobacteriota bacterium]